MNAGTSMCPAPEGSARYHDGADAVTVVVRNRVVVPSAHTSHGGVSSFVDSCSLISRVGADASVSKSPPWSASRRSRAKNVERTALAAFDWFWTAVGGEVEIALARLDA